MAGRKNQTTSNRDKGPRRSRRRAVGIIFVILGALCLIAAALLFSYNAYEDARAKQSSDEAMARIVADINDPSTLSNNEMIDGQRYVGYLEMPSLEVSLPVMADLSYPNLRTAPCLYTGSVKTHDLVIAAHNYSAHFGCIKDLQEHDVVYYTGTDAVRHTYEVGMVEIVDPDQADYVMNSEWDLTLFTCTYGGAQRVTVRCKEIL